MVRVSPAASPSPSPESGPRIRPAQASPGAERSILGTRRLVTFYGYPGVPQLGIVGELEKEDLVAQLEKQVAAYTELDGLPVQGAIHLIAEVAQGSPGQDGLYLNRMPHELIEEYSELARQNDLLLILDLQIGRSTVPDEIAHFRQHLTQPHVHLALDPEFDMGPGEIPAEQVGSMEADDINSAIRTLAEIARDNNLPNKVLIVHQFERDMILGKDTIQDDPRVDVVIDMDGWGSPDTKIEQYGRYVRSELIEFGGIKLFYKQDKPLLTEEQVLALEPKPNVIIYQ
ncbi:MAG TPA: hypothetical protein VHL09_04200 [Dehalococcoidia bacterium]|nr:hypothetical protein [Dehalococcoidia bacterium]